MSFAVRNLSVLAYANGFTLWHYRSDCDALAEISDSGFFDPAVDLVASGDMLMISAPEGARILALRCGSGGVTAAPVI